MNERAMKATKRRGAPIICDTPMCGGEIPVGGEGDPEICPACLKRAAAAQGLTRTAPRKPIGHVLKCWPRQFDEVDAAERHFEIRKDDRDYARGDFVVLVEYDPETQQHTGRSMTRTIGLLGRGKPYPDGYCAFSLEYGNAVCTAPGQGRGR